MPAIIVIITATAVMYFIFFLEENATKKNRKPKPEKRPFPAVFTLWMTGIVILPPVFTVAVFGFTHNIEFSEISKLGLHLSSFLTTTLYAVIVFGTIFVSLIFYIYVVFFHRFWLYLIGLPFQFCTFFAIFLVFMLQPRIEIFQQLSIESKSYYLIDYDNFGSATLFLLECENSDFICKSTKLDYIHSFHYSAGHMSYHPDTDSLYIQATSFEVEEYIIPLNSDK